MFRLSMNALRATAIAIPALLATAVAAPATAQVRVSISYNTFHNELSRYGRWSYDPRWGDVWQPSRVSNFRPYSNGHWVNTREYGWLWVSNERFGDITYHYGRWVADPRRGWLWVPGYVWAPAWVVWRTGGGNVAWFPMPPGDNYRGSGAYRASFDNRYGYNEWYGPSYSNDRFLSLWIVVGQDNFADQNYRNYVRPQRTYGSFFTQSRDATNYSTVNNYVVNRSIETLQPQRGSNQRFQPVPAESVIGRNAMITPANVGIQVEQQEQRQRRTPASLSPTVPADSGTRSLAPTQPNMQRAPAPQAVAPDNGNANSQNRSQSDRGPATPQSERGAPVTTPGSGNETSQSRSQRDRGPATPQAPVAPEARAVPAPQAPVVANQDRGNSRTNNRVQDNRPAAPDLRPAAPPQAPVVANQDRGNGRGNVRAQDSNDAKPADAKPSDDKEKDDNKDAPGRGRGRN